MAKLDGIDPRKGRKTLGQALLDLVNDDELDDSTVLHTAVITQGVPETKDSKSAKAVMTRPNYSASENSLQNSANAKPIDDASLEQGLYDLSPGALKATSAYAKDALDGYNDYVPSEVASEATGGRRGDALQPAGTNEAQTFESEILDVHRKLGTSPFDEITAQIAYLRNQSGGGGTSKRGGGFFTAEQISDIIDKISSSGDIEKTSALLASVAGGNVAK